VSKFAVILPAAGKSSRFRDKNYKKPFAPLAGRAVWLHVAEKFLNRNDVKQTILIVSQDDREFFDFKFAGNAAILGVEVVEGGAERADSVERALARVKNDIDFIAVHDAARPCIVDEWITAVFEAAQKHDAAIPAVPVSSTLKRVAADHTISETVDRSGLWEAQTPQVFRRQLLMEAYAKRGGFTATDESQLVERLGKKVHIVPGSNINIKITTREDLRLAEAALGALPKPKFGGPIHPFADDDHWK
jgi:2-C-methyl-D-erythritol 4-phosphate cytidylyltransferase